MDNLSNYIVISTQVSISRNIAGYKFPKYMEFPRDRLDIVQIVKSNIDSLYSNKIMYTNDLSLFDKECLIKRQIANRGLFSNNESAIITNLNHDLYIYMNEQDHIRIVSKQDGNQLNKEYEYVNMLDDELSKEIKFAYTDDFGYLTASPTLLGTGLKATASVFLFATIRKNKFDSVLNIAKRYNLILSNSLGEGSSSFNYVFQIRNSLSFGVSESKLIKDMQDAIKEIEEIEIQQRIELLGDDLILLKDEFTRAVGVLSHAQILTYEEFVRLNTILKNASIIGLTNIPLEELIQLEDEVEPVSLCRKCGNELLDGNQSFRANIVREFFS